MAVDVVETKTRQENSLPLSRQAAESVSAAPPRNQPRRQKNVKASRLLSKRPYNLTFS